MKRRDASADFTRDEWEIVHQLQLRYQQDHDLLTAHEVARLRFLCWLAVTGRLVDDGGPAPTGERIKAATREAHP
jgi:hypothetical protein